MPHGMKLIDVVFRTEKCRTIPWNLFSVQLIYDSSAKSLFPRQAHLPVGTRLYCTPLYEHEVGCCVPVARVQQRPSREARTGPHGMRILGRIVGARSAEQSVGIIFAV